MGWIKHARAGFGALLILTSLVGLVGLPDDLQTWGGLLEPVGGQVGWAALLLVGLALLILPPFLDRRAANRASNQSEVSPRSKTDSVQRDPRPSLPARFREAAEGNPPGAAEPRVTPLPSIGISPAPMRPMSLETALELERDEGARLLAALRDPLGGLATYGRGAGEREVKAWTANVKHLLRDDPERLALFEWEPLTPLGSFMQSLVLSVSGQDQTRRMEHRLAQLDKVIAEL